ncbi:RICIN domain-containing protein [Kitasatospora sp. NPDC051853]|uniref:RICIN domain-containing protein n=1 Tax=Kitasatospora sp. NPDC051853 TaxID=3364058 RepID=UPI0037B27CC5
MRTFSRIKLLGLLGAGFLAVTAAAPPAQAGEVGVYARFIKNDVTRTCLDVPEVSGAHFGDRVGVYWCSADDNQRWNLLRTGSFPYHLPNGVVIYKDKFLVSSYHGDNLCLDLPGQGGDLPNGTEIRLHTCITQNDNQEWYWDDSAGPEVLVNYQTGKCLDVDGQAWNQTDRGPRTTWLYDCWGQGGDTDDHAWYTTPYYWGAPSS